MKAFGTSLSQLTPETAFLLLGLAAGILTILVTPPFDGADEPAHLRRAYQVSLGRLLAERKGDEVGGFLPPAIRLRRPATGEPVFVDFRNTALYAPVPYLPHALAIAFGRSLELEPEPLLRLVRLVGLAASLALGFLAIRIAPIAKHLLLLLGLTPMAVRQMSMVSADSLTNGASLLLLALFLRSALAASPPSTGSFLGILLCALAVTLTKIAYFPLVLLYFLIPADHLGGWRRQVMGFVVLAGVCAAAAAAWLWLIRDLYVTQSIAPTADPAGQTSFILAHPLLYARVLLADLHRNAETYVRLCLGHVGPLGRPLALLQLTALAAVALVDGRSDVALDRRGKAILLFVFAATYALVNTFNYLGWNPVGSPAIEHVQGRYYIPIAPLPFLLLSNRRLASLIPTDRLTKLAACLAVLLLAPGFGSVALRKYRR